MQRELGFTGDTAAPLFAMVSRLTHQKGVDFVLDALPALLAGSDAVLVPSRFEPCGLTQLYSLRYGTLPVVCRTGGLADTVVDAAGDSASAGTGFLCDDPAGLGFAATVRRAFQCYDQPERWRSLVLAAMSRDFSWQASTQTYQSLYEQLAAGAGE